ncbi:MAG: phosphatidylglycerophosphatase A family protein [Pyrinomonadaceae bacterium]
MAIKESSDELNPPLVPGTAVPRPARTAKDYLALAIATCGVGYLPLAPGTWGSLLAVAVYWFAALLMGGSIDTAATIDAPTFFGAQVIAIVAITVLGIWAASVTERALAAKDPGKVVIDEVAGQLIALSPLPLMMSIWPERLRNDAYGVVMIPAAFLLFRFFDIVKPYPARKMESLHGGLGIMADDLVAGVYAAIGVALLVVIRAYM